MNRGLLQKLEKYPGFWLDPASEIIYWRGTIKGKRIKKSTGTKKIKEAKTFIDDFILSLTSVNIDKAKRAKRGIRNPRIEMLWNDLIEERSLTRSSSTMNTYRFSWEHKIGPFWKNLNVSDVSENKVWEFQKWFLQTFKNDRFFQTRKHLTMLLNYLHKEGYVEKKIKVENLDKTDSKRSKHQTPHRVYTKSEIGKFLAGAPSISSRCAVCMTLYLFTGMRKMELLSRKWSDINWDEKTMDVFSTKNKKWRKVPLIPASLKALGLWEKQSEGTKSEFIFPMATDHKRHIIGQEFDKDWVRLKGLVKIKGRARVHDLRHTFATRTALDGWSIAVACAVLDMSSDEYIKTYVHINHADIRKSMEKTFRGGL